MQLKLMQILEISDFVDQNEDGLINGDDRVNLGDPIPSINYGD